MSGVIVIIASVTGLCGTVLLWLTGAPLMVAALIGYGLSALGCGIFILRVARMSRGPVSEPLSGYRRPAGDIICRPGSLKLRH